MLGGFAKISHTDIDGSNKLLKSLFKVEVMTPHISWFCNNNSPTVFRKGGGRSWQRKSPGLWCWHWKDHETPPDQGDPKHLHMLCISKILAPQHFERVDLLEQDKHFLEKAVEYLDGNNRLSTCSLKYLSAWTATSKYSSLYTVNIWILGW